MKASLARGPLLGRDEELARLAACANDALVVAVTGPPGVGKTRLVQEWLAGLPPRSVGAVVLVRGARTEDDVLSRIAGTCGVSAGEGPVAASVRRIARALARRRVRTVVLDDAEACPRIVATVAALLAGEGVRVVVVSRDRLPLAEARVLELPPLPLASAAELFVRRAEATRGAPLAPHELSGVPALVAALDGLPLAIELAAGRTTALTVDELSRRAAGRLALLSTSAVDIDARSASLSACLDASWELLTPEEARAFVVASVFASPFSVDALAAVLDGSPRAALSVVESLRARSLLVERPSPPGEGRRFGLYQVVREYAAARLAASGGADEARARHVAYFDARARARARTTGGVGATTLSGDDAAELPELAQALAHAQGTDAAATARLALALSAVLSRTGPASTRRDALWTALSRLSPHEEPALVFELLQELASLENSSGLALVALRAQRLAVPLAESMGDQGRLALALARRGWDAFETGDPVAARVDVDRAASISRAAGDAERESYALDRSGLLAFAEGDARRAEHELRRSVELAVLSGSTWMFAKSLVELCCVLCACGDADELGRGVARLAQHEMPNAGLWGLRESLSAALHRDAGRLAAADAALARAEAATDAVGMAGLVAEVLVARAAVATDQGDLEGALRLLDRAEEVAVRTHYARPMALVRLGRAAVLDEREERDAAWAEGRRALERARAASDAHLEAEARLTLAIASLGRDAPHDAVDHAQDGLRALGDRGSARHRALLFAAVAASASTSAERGDARAQALSALAEVSERATRDVVVRWCSDGDLEGAPTTSLGRRIARLGSGTRTLELHVEPDLAWFAFAGGKRRSLARHRSLRLVLRALVARHRAGAGAALGRDELLAEGWPGERMRPESGAFRVYTTVRRLRALGLAGLLVTRGDGYALHPSVRIVVH